MAMVMTIATLTDMATWTPKAIVKVTATAMAMVVRRATARAMGMMMAMELAT